MLSLRSVLDILNLTSITKFHLLIKYILKFNFLENCMEFIKISKYFVEVNKYKKITLQFKQIYKKKN